MRSANAPASLSLFSMVGLFWMYKGSLREFGRGALTAAWRLGSDPGLPALSRRASPGFGGRHREGVEAAASAGLRGHMQVRPC